MELQLNEYYDAPFQVTNLPGVDLDCAALPTFRVYAEGSDTPIETGDCVKRDDANTVGHYAARTQLTAVKGYAIGTIYHVRITAVNGSDSCSTELPAFLVVPADVLRQNDFTGSGARTVLVTVNDGANPLQSVTVRMTSGVNTYVWSTNASGQVTFNVDDGTWTVALALLGYTFAGASLVVNGDKTPTYSMTQVTFPASDPGLITGYLYCYDEDGVIEPGASVVIEFVSASTSSTGISNDTAQRTGTSGADGLVTFANLLPGATYRVRRGASSRWKNITIPAAATSPYALPAVWGKEE